MIASALTDDLNEFGFVVIGGEHRHTGIPRGIWHFRVNHDRALACGLTRGRNHRRRHYTLAIVRKHDGFGFGTCGPHRSADLRGDGARQR